MKKSIIIAMVSLCIIGVCGCSLGRINQVENNINESVALNNINQIDIEIGVLEANINSYSGDEIMVSGNVGRYADDIEVKQSGNTIKIEDKSSLTSIFGINFGKTNSTLNISIPEKFSGDINFKYGAGSSKISGVKANKLTIEGGAGELKIDDIIFNKCKLSAGVGSTKMYLSEKCGDIEIKGGVGEVIVEMDEVGGGFKFDGGVGSTKVRIPKDSPVNFKTKSGIGACNINAKTSNEGTYTFDLSVGVGEIQVNN